MATTSCLSAKLPLTYSVFAENAYVPTNGPIDPGGDETVIVSREIV
jgi:hypothetical protein